MLKRGLVVLLVLVSSAAVWGQEESFRLSLSDCLRSALESNLDLESARYAPQAAEQEIMIEQGNQFDTVFNSSYTRREQESAATQSSTVTGSTSDTFNAGLDKNTKFGLTASVDFSVFHAEQTGPNVVAPESYFSSTTLGFTLPLLKGFGTETNTERLILRQNDLEISRTDLEGQAETMTERVEGAYWDVLAARAALRIARISLERAEDLLVLNRKKVEVGTLAPIEITQAEAGVASQEEGVIVAEVTLMDAEDELRRLMAIPESDPRWGYSIEPTDRPEFTVMNVDLDAAIQTALAERSEMSSIRQSLRNSELNERVAQRQVKHQLDFVGSYQSTGASLDEFVIIDGQAITIPNADLGDSIDNIPDNDQYDWRAQVVYRVPLRNRAAKAIYARARISREQSEVDVRNQEQTIRVEVRRAVRGVNSGIKRVEAAQKNVELQTEKLDAEQKKFENGMSTSFEVLTFQNDLADAELSEIRARLDYIKALAALERSKGTLLEARGLEFAD